MRSVFIHQIPGNSWRIIDKKTGKIFEEINDVLLFNAEYKKYKNIKGWHGILSEEINEQVIHEMDILSNVKRFLTFITGIYYPRLLGQRVTHTMIARFYKDTINISGPNQKCGYGLLDELTSKWNSKEDMWEDIFDEEDDEDDYPY